VLAPGTIISTVETKAIVLVGGKLIVGTPGIIVHAEVTIGSRVGSGICRPSILMAEEAARQGFPGGQAGADTHARRQAGGQTRAQAGTRLGSTHITGPITPTPHGSAKGRRIIASIGHALYRPAPAEKRRDQPEQQTRAQGDGEHAQPGRRSPTLVGRHLLGEGLGIASLDERQARRQTLCLLQLRRRLLPLALPGKQARLDIMGLGRMGMLLEDFRHHPLRPRQIPGLGSLIDLVHARPCRPDQGAEQQQAQDSQTSDKSLHDTLPL